MGIKVEVTGDIVAEDTGGGFDPLPAGVYEATIYDAKVGEYNSVKNKGRPKMDIQYRIADGQKGANRRIFESVPLFTNWNNEGKTDAFPFFRFFAAVQGMTNKDFRTKATEDAESKKGLSVPAIEEILGKKVLLKLAVEKDDYAFNKSEDPDAVKEDFTRNNVADVTAPKAGGAKKAAKEDEAFTL